MSGARAPIPPVGLAVRVGPGESEDPIEAYLREGAAVRERIERLLPEDWSWAGKRVLDFGCGSARVLRQFLREAEQAEFWGCDIDAPSVAWVQANLSPPLRVFDNAFAPPLALNEGYFDLVYASSVFTHIGDLWSDWLLELHRILAPGGRLISSFLGEGMWEALIGEAYREEAVGMTVRRHWTEQDALGLPLRVVAARALGAAVRRRRRRATAAERPGNSAGDAQLYRAHQARRRDHEGRAGALRRFGAPRARSASDQRPAAAPRARRRG